VETVWNHTVCQVWVPRQNAVERLPAEALASQEQPRKATLDRLVYAVAAARIADALTQDLLLAPLEAGVIPLPHQLYALSRAMSDDRIRYLLADEVGLGKTIEAGLVFRELKLRGLVKRALVVAPKGLVPQWVEEMRTHFNEEFQLLTILDEFGVDKNEDVLDSAESGSLFEQLYAQAILNPGGIEANIEKLIQEVRAQAVQGRAGRSLYADVKLDPALAQQMINHPLPFWVERMTTAYLRAEGGSVVRDLFDLSLTWPDGTRMNRVTFDRKLEEEQRAWEAELRKRERVLPELQPVTVVRVEAGDG